MLLPEKIRASCERTASSLCLSDLLKTPARVGTSVFLVRRGQDYGFRKSYPTFVDVFGVDSGWPENAPSVINLAIYM